MELELGRVGLGLELGLDRVELMLMLDLLGWVPRTIARRRVKLYPTDWCWFWFGFWIDFD